MFKIILAAFISCCLIIGCEKKIEKQLPQIKKQLVVNSILSPNYYIKLHLSHTTSMYESNSTEIKNAVVEIWEDGDFLETLTYSGNNLYESKVNKPVPGHIYRASIKVEGFEQVLVTDTIPYPVEIDSSYYKFYMSDDIDFEMNADLFVEFTDPVDEKNYYELIFYSIDTSVNYQTQDTSLSINYFNDFQRYDPILIAEEDINYNPTTLFFSDNLFNGKSISFQVNINTDGGGCLYGVCDFSFGLKIAELRSVSFSYYQFRKKWTRHLYNQGAKLNIQSSDEFRAFLFTGEPVNMYSNVQNGYGVFTGYSESSFNMINTLWQ